MSEEKNDDSSGCAIDEVKCKGQPWISSRMILVILCFFGTINLYSMRVSLSVGIICMTNQTSIKLAAKSENLTVAYGPQCEVEDSANNTALRDGTLLWDSKLQGIVLGVFFWGYLATQIPAGFLSQRFGAKIVVTVFTILSGLSTVLIPVASNNIYLVITLRVICGMASGVWFPCFHHLFSYWLPPNERSKLVSFAYAGLYVGNALTIPISGALCQVEAAGGWPLIFYIFGGFALIWVLPWCFLVFDGPDVHPRISRSERIYINKSLTGQLQHSSKVNFPIIDVLKSLPFWAILVVNVCYDWSGYTFLTSTPMYMKDVLGFDLSSKGIFMSLPFIGLWVGTVIASFSSEALEKREILSVTWARKLFNTIGMITPGVLVIIMGFMTCKEKYFALALFTLAMIANASVMVGCFINHVDIAPRYAGILFGITNSVASITGFFAPYSVGAITTTKHPHEWRLVFIICGIIYFFGGIFYLIFASAVLQPWANKGENENDDGATRRPEQEVELLNVTPNTSS